MPDPETIALLEEMEAAWKEFAENEARRLAELGKLNSNYPTLMRLAYMSGFNAGRLKENDEALANIESHLKASGVIF